MSAVEAIDPDLAVGTQIRTIDLYHGSLWAAVATAIIVAVVYAVVAFINLRAAVTWLPLGLIPILMAGIAAFLPRKQPRRVEVYERGFRVIASLWSRIVRWDDVTGVQINRVSDTFYSVPLWTLLSVRRSGPAQYSLGPTDYVPQHFDKCVYIFHLVDGARFELTGDGRLFGLADDITKNVFNRLIPDMIQRFEAGEAIGLTDTVSYTKAGLMGTLIRETRHARREIPMTFGWGDITQLSRTSKSLQITVGHQQPIIVPMSEIINAPGFLRILKSLAEQAVIPDMSRTRER